MGTVLVAYTSICEADACWIPQYLSEVERLGIPFAMHFDRCSNRTKRALSLHRMCIGHTANDDPSREFLEWDKQGVLDLAARQADWVLGWDIDETWAADAGYKFDEIMQLDIDYIDYKWVTLWEDRFHHRIDPPFNNGHRANLYRVGNGREWKFLYKQINGPKMVINDSQVPAKMERRHDLVCLHHGMMTEDLRIEHKERWDRIYTAACGKNPYGFWNYALDKSVTPVVEKHDYI